MKEPAIRVRLDQKSRLLLDRLRDERHVNISSWAREHIRNGLREEFPEEFQDQEDRPEETADETPEPPPPEPLPPLPIPGWRPKKIDEDKAGKAVWGAALKQPDVDQLPDELRGIQITVTTTAGRSWTGTIEEVVSRTEELVVVRYSRGTD